MMGQQRTSDPLSHSGCKPGPDSVATARSWRSQELGGCRQEDAQGSTHGGF